MLNESDREERREKNSDKDVKRREKRRRKIDGEQEAAVEAGDAHEAEVDHERGGQDPGQGDPGLGQGIRGRSLRGGQGQERGNLGQGQGLGNAPGGQGPDLGHDVTEAVLGVVLATGSLAGSRDLNPDLGQSDVVQV